jgi:transcriptional regulator with XRE-family HTH domain
MSEAARTQGRTPGSKVFGTDGWHQRMREARERADLSVEAVARTLSVSSSAVRNWEGGHKVPSRENLQEFADATSADMVWLVTSFTAAELKLAGKMIGQARAVPFFRPNQLLQPKSWEDAPTVIASFPCSDAAFATELFDHRNGPEYEAGDIVIIDPVPAPSHDDWVLANIGQSIVFARYSLRGVEQMLTEAIGQRLKDTEIEVFGPEDTKRLVLKLTEEIKASVDRGQPTAWLVPARGEPFAFRDTEDRILGVMVEHRRPRRALSTDHIVGKQSEA